MKQDAHLFILDKFDLYFFHMTIKNTCNFTEYGEICGRANKKKTARAVLSVDI